MNRSRPKKSIQFALLIILSFTLILNLFLYAQLRKYYTYLHAVELDPIGLSYFQEPEQKPDKNLRTFVFFGDSRAAQWPPPTANEFWFVNRGIGGQTTPQIMGRFDAHVAPLQPDIILVQMGINDLKTIPLFPLRKNEIIAGCKQNILDVLERSRSLNSVVIVSTVFPTGKIPLLRRLVWSKEIEEAVVEINDYIKGLAGDQVFILDAASLLSDENGKLRADYSVDELHLNQAGYDVLNLELEKLLENIRKVSP